MSTRRLENFLRYFTIDNVSDFVNKYLIQMVVSFIIAGIVIFAFIFVGDQKDARDYKLTEQYYKAIKSDSATAKVMLEEIYARKGNNINTRAISGLKLADILKSENDFDGAKNIYRKVFTFKKADAFLRNLAGLDLVNLLVNQNEYSEAEKLFAELKNEGNPLMNLVLEQEAMFEIQRGNNAAAKNILNNLLTKDIDADLNTRAQILLSLE